MKQCCTCKQEKPLDQFRKMAKAKDGLQARCTDCAKAYYADNRDRIYPQIMTAQKVRRDERVAMLMDYLREHPCVDCGESDIIVLDFDHVIGEKEMSVPKMVRECYSIARIQQEIAKCQIRCANCHRKITAMRAVTLGNAHNRWDATWGTVLHASIS